MSAPLIAACLWLIAANVMAMLPSRDGHWTQASVLAALGVPLLGWLTLAHGPVLGALGLAAGASVLRWPVICLLRRLRGMAPARQEPAE